MFPAIDTPGMLVLDVLVMLGVLALLLVTIVVSVERTDSLPPTSPPNHPRGVQRRGSAA